MQQFGELALIIGDFHIPMRTAEVPDKFKELLVPNKVQHVICTGNIGNRETTDWLKSLSNNFHVVKGDFDELSGVSDVKSITIGNFKIGIIHGHQVTPWGDEEALYNYQRELDCDLLVSGHTHDSKITKFDGKYFLNPGSATGAYSASKPENNPSFCILEFRSDEITVYMYEFVSEKVSITKTILKK
eukprot:TRINITY_DN0_c4233_g1_i3.p1 TRINITY_DN0_c4233_g1~~TRINITY_DN0_c4233_g1_i3.p1  ORF type:complete len:187 (+),score=52.42 TRINITY_DN0_c4233_g1_i3:40-600(+)